MLRRRTHLSLGIAIGSALILYTVTVVSLIDEVICREIPLTTVSL